LRLASSPDRHAAGYCADIRLRERQGQKEPVGLAKFTDESGYRANCDESETQNDYIKQNSGVDFDKRLSGMSAGPGTSGNPFEDQQLWEIGGYM
jgi:hypothetical protein